MLTKDHLLSRSLFDMVTMMPNMFAYEQNISARAAQLAGPLVGQKDDGKKLDGAAQGTIKETFESAHY